MKTFEKIKLFLRDKFDLILFIAILTIIVCVYNLNNQTLNYFLNRGTSLIYSYENINNPKYEANIKETLNKYNIKYQYIESIDLSQYEEYDNELNEIQNTVVVGIPIFAEQNKISIFNDISNTVFENFKNAKLLSIRPMGYYYNTPYLTFKIYFLITLLTLIIWLCLLFCFKFNATKEKCKKIFSKKEKVKEQSSIKKDYKYYLKKLILDDDKIDDENTNITKEIISTIVFVLVCVVVIRHFIGELRWIPSGSMFPTIVEKDRVFVEKLDYPVKKEIKRGDILVFYPPSEKLSNSPLKIIARLTGIFCKDVAYIKRVVGMPNDKLEIKQDEKSGYFKVYINDKPLNEPYIRSKTKWNPCVKNMYCGPFKIPEDNYFMMGDNRGNSQDSRYWGFLDKKRIIGRANFMFYPISRINVLKDKYFELQKTKDEKELYILDRY